MDEENCVADLNEDFPITIVDKTVKKRNVEIFLELKHKRRQGKCFGAAPIEIPKIMPKSTIQNEPIIYNIISNDTWIHISKHIEPEDVQHFALICYQTANIVNTKEFWSHLYHKYCKTDDGGVRCNIARQLCKMPESLRMFKMKKYNKKHLRMKVIKSLFYCYRPLKQRIENGYKLDTLIGRKLISFWWLNKNCILYLCIKLSNLKNYIKESEQSIEKVVDNWEALANEEFYEDHFDSDKYISSNSDEGACLLLIPTSHVLLPPISIIEECENMSYMTLKATRKLLAKDLKAYNLELDFEHSINKIVKTIKYTQISSYYVIPWWHPTYDISISWQDVHSPQFDSFSDR